MVNSTISCPPFSFQPKVDFKQMFLKRTSLEVCCVLKEYFPLTCHCEYNFVLSKIVVVSKPDEDKAPVVKKEPVAAAAAAAAIPPPVVATGPISLPSEATEIPKVCFVTAIDCRISAKKSMITIVSINLSKHKK